MPGMTRRCVDVVAPEMSINQKRISAMDRVFLKVTCQDVQRWDGETGESRTPSETRACGIGVRGLGWSQATMYIYAASRKTKSPK